jgi:hypothetical protein
MMKYSQKMPKKKTPFRHELLLPVAALVLHEHCDHKQGEGGPVQREEQGGVHW